MGLFAARPEEPFEWAGLPSEPLNPESEAERLDDGVDLDPAGLAGSGFGSIVIPLPVATEAEAATEAEEAAEPPGP